MSAKKSTTLNFDLKVTVLYGTEFSEAIQDRLHTVFKKKTGAKELFVRSWHHSDLEKAGTYGKPSQYVVIMPDLRNDAAEIIRVWNSEYHPDHPATFIVLEHPVMKGLTALAHEHNTGIVKL